MEVGLYCSTSCCCDSPIYRFICHLHHMLYIFISTLYVYHVPLHWKAFFLALMLYVKCIL